MNVAKIRSLSARLGRHPSTVFRWFNGTRNISRNDAVKLERETGIDRRAWLWPDEFPNPMLQSKRDPDQSSVQKAVYS